MYNSKILRYFSISLAPLHDISVCSCNETGSYNTSCSAVSGQCYCQPGVGNQQCDSCLKQHTNFSSSGCDGKFMKSLIIPYQTKHSGHNSVIKPYFHQFQMYLIQKFYYCKSQNSVTGACKNVLNPTKPYMTKRRSKGVLTNSDLLRIKEF